MKYIEKAFEIFKISIDCIRMIIKKVAHLFSTNVLLINVSYLGLNKIWT